MTETRYMRIGLDITALAGGLTSGTPVYLYNLLRAMLDTEPEARFSLLYNHRRESLPPEIAEISTDPRVEIVCRHLSRGAVPADGWWFPYHPSVSKLLGPLDVYHAGDSIWPRADGTPTVITVHDVTTKLYPEHHWWANRARHARKLRWARRSADRIIAVSSATRLDLVRHLGVESSRIDVVPEARGWTPATGLDREPSILDVRQRYGLADRPYILTVGTLEPRKNHVRLIRA